MKILRELNARKAKYGFEGCYSSSDPDTLRACATVFEAAKWIDPAVKIEEVVGMSCRTCYKIYTEVDALAVELRKYC